ncbi:MAG: hypothetical protein HQM08_25235 [Candidatus Riflebacteria bacterium]|nr:hypothetical protein [Candidatus Riflebacteria bacterium]
MKNRCSLLQFAFLLTMFLSLGNASEAYQLTLYTMPPPHHLDWSSPRALIWGCSIGNRLTFSNMDHKHTMGHVFVELNSESDYDEFAGSTTAPDAPNDADFITKQGYGLGVFFANFRGCLDPGDNLKKQLQNRYANSTVNYINFKISKSTFDRLFQYLAMYKYRNYQSVYSGLNKPREGKGAGCSIFGVSFVELAGFLCPEWVNRWQIHVKLPQSMVGGPMTKQFVSMWTVIRENRWAQPNEPFIPLDLYDPDLISQWILQAWDKVNFEKLHGGGHPFGDPILDRAKPSMRGQAKGLEIDATDVPTPTDPIWQGDALNFKETPQH